jgi:hypothetical protein
MDWMKVHQARGDPRMQQQQQNPMMDARARARAERDQQLQQQAQAQKVAASSLPAGMGLELRITEKAALIMQGTDCKGRESLGQGPRMKFHSEVTLFTTPNLLVYSTAEFINSKLFYGSLVNFTLIQTQNCFLFLQPPDTFTLL